MSTSRNLLKVFLVLSFIYLAIILLGFDNVSRYMKPLLLPVLFYSVQRSKTFKTQNWLLSALLFSWFGDCILLFADQGELYFILGLISFLIAHILLIVLFSKQPKAACVYMNFRGFWIGLGLVVLYLFGMLYLLLPVLGDLKLAVGMYAITISLMLIETIKGVYNWNKDSKYLILIGAALFVASDSILAIDKFYSPIPESTFWIMSTYLMAQFCIAYGIIKLNHKKIALH